jgi:DNA-binding NtrC family response regulator
VKGAYFAPGGAIQDGLVGKTALPLKTCGFEPAHGREVVGRQRSRRQLDEPLVARRARWLGERAVVRLPANLEWLEARAIEEALKACGGNRTKAASILGINRVTLYKKLKVD